MRARARARIFLRTSGHLTTIDAFSNKNKNSHIEASFAQIWLFSIAMDAP